VNFRRGVLPDRFEHALHEVFWPHEWDLLTPFRRQDVLDGLVEDLRDMGLISVVKGFYRVWDPRAIVAIAVGRVAPPN
jgi:hypothetical protein